MGEKEFELIYNYTPNTANSLDTFGFTLGVALVVFSIVYIRMLFKRKTIIHFKFKAWFLGGMLAFLFLLCCVFLHISSRDSKSMTEGLKGIKSVEGLVTDFHPLHEKDKSLERFTVDGVEFRYSKFVMGYGFNNLEPYILDIKENQYLRIQYIYHRWENVIVRLEIRKEWYDIQ